VHDFRDIRPIVVADCHVNPSARKFCVSRTVSQRLVDAGRRGGGKLYGYQDIRGTLDPEQAEVVRRIFAEWAAGKGLYVIARGLERDQGKPVRGKGWYVSQVQSIIRNTTYKGLLTWGAERRIKRKGKIVYEKSPENVITRPAEQYRIVSDKVWAEANAISDASGANTWRDAAGRLKSRATKSPFLLSPFIACACGASMHAKQSGKGDKKVWLYTCTARHLLGKKACSVGGRGIRVEWLDKAICTQFEEALVGHVVLAQLQGILDAQKSKAIDPEPLKRSRRSWRKRSSGWSIAWRRVSYPTCTRRSASAAPSWSTFRACPRAWAPSRSSTWPRSPRRSRRSWPTGGRVSRRTRRRRLRCSAS
jgi:Recombinase/Recombinase zinc beta ribbon domain